MTTPTNTRSQGGAEPGPADAVARLPFAIMDDELSALNRFYETTEDGQDYDVPVPMMKRLAVIGLVRRVTGNRYEFTDFGLSVCNGDFADGADQHALAAPASAQEALTDERMFEIIRGTGYVTRGQAWEIVELLRAALASAQPKTGEAGR